ncbi:hypothetical protein [Engelhardtia mirabilis]
MPAPETAPQSSQPASGAAPRAALAWALVAAVTAFAFQATIARTTGLIDDGGITLRYAERVATGAGFDYDPVGAINGASNPLYTLLLAGLLRLGIAPWMAVQAIGITCMAAAAGLLTHALVRYHCAAAAVFAFGALVTNNFLTSHLVTGLEAPLTILLVTALFQALHSRSQVWVGLCLGLLVANKVDGGAAALAFAAAFALAERRFPWRATAVAVATSLPIFAVLWINFGTLVPGAAATKIAVHESAHFDRTWVLDGLLAQGHPARLLYLAAGSTLLLLARRTRSIPLLTIGGWLSIHVAAYSLIDLGDPYPWYLVAPLVLLIPLAALLLERVLEVGLTPLPQRFRAGVGLGLVTVLSALAFRGSLTKLVLPGGGPDYLHPFTLSDLARQSTGAWLAANTSGTELFSSPFGLPAYEYGGPVYDPTGLNNVLDDSRNQAALYHITEVLEGPPAGLNHNCRLVVFFRFGEDSMGYAIHAARGSEVLASGVTFLPGVEERAPTPLDPAALKGASDRVRRRIAAWNDQVLSGNCPDWAGAQ